ncbi:hypothetical protein [Evansella tamaricis]|uniref:Uncharacterized protein n=1 Tax=Evansella tamaricis TaxID=2069301 RepID=A0ABS6JK82_9BACI|nr:hypothetical protein [Evansella tamaricis]MBU9714091.1 hypothetical protein [Evansella tamaricis]
MQLKKVNKLFLGSLIGIILAFLIYSVVTNEFKIGMLLSILAGGAIGYGVLFFLIKND